MNPDDFFLHTNCRYIAVIEGSVSKKSLIAISEGTVIDGVHCTPDSVELLPQQPEMSRSRLRIVVLTLSLSHVTFVSHIIYMYCNSYDYYGNSIISGLWTEVAIEHMNACNVTFVMAFILSNWTHAGS